MGRAISPLALAAAALLFIATPVQAYVCYAAGYTYGPDGLCVVMRCEYTAEVDPIHWTIFAPRIFASWRQHRG
jgi:hypothetical protein